MSKRLISAAAGAACLAIALTGCGEAEKAAKDAADKAKEHGKGALACATEKGAEQAKKGEANTEEMKDCAQGGTSGDESGDATSAASGDASGAADGATDGATDGAAQGGAAGGLEVDLGDFSDDPAAMAVGDFYTARQDALADGDTAEVATLVTPDYLKKVEKFVAKRQGKKNPYQVSVTAVEGDTVDACVGPKGAVARTITVTNGKVASIGKSDATC